MVHVGAPVQLYAANVLVADPNVNVRRFEGVFSGVHHATQKTLDGIVERRLLLRGFIERLGKADGQGPHRAYQKRPFVERRRTPCTSAWQPPAPSAAARRWW